MVASSALVRLMIRGLNGSARLAWAHLVDSISVSGDHEADRKELEKS